MAPRSIVRLNPTPISIPPKTDDRIASVLSGGMILAVMSMPNDVSAVATAVLIINSPPILTYPKIKTGMFKAKSVMPVGSDVI